MLEVIPREPFNTAFPAMNTVWKLDGIVVSRVSAPAVRVKRTPSQIRRNPIDHWVLSFCQRGEMAIMTERSNLQARPGVPFLWSRRAVAPARGLPDVDRSKNHAVDLVNR
jgi:hypothetical protein